MASHIQIILRQDVETLGHRGELVRVRPGYARNYLIPRGLAAAATRSNIKEIEHERQIAAQRLDKMRKEQEEIAEKLKKVVIMIAKEVGEGGRLFGSVTAADISESLLTKGFEVDKKKIVMPDSAIKEVGSYEAQVKLQAGVSVKIKIEVKTAA